MFVRHNGGSVFLDLPPGKPWIKHSCYYDPIILSYSDQVIEDAIRDWLKLLDDPYTGVVYDVEQDHESNKFLFVNCVDNISRKVPVYVPFSLDGFLGEFVIFSSESNKLVRPYLNVKSEINLIAPPPVTLKWPRQHVPRNVSRKSRPNRNSSAP